MLSFKQYETLNEQLILYNQGKRYGQVVFLAGGAGSGKGFSLSNFMEKDKFKVIDVDDFKTSFLKIANTKDKYPELRGLNLRNPKDVFALHLWVKKHNIKFGVVSNILDAATNPDHLPNIIFDTTFKDLGDIYEYLPWLLDLGYKSTDIHLTWVLSNYQTAVLNNRGRERVVPDDVVLQTHEGAAITMGRIIRGHIPKMMNGEIRVILCGKENVVMATRPDGTPVLNRNQLVKTRNQPTGLVKSFKYLTLKKSGKPIDKVTFRDQLQDWIEANVPKTALTKHLWRNTKKAA